VQLVYFCQTARALFRTPRTTIFPLGSLCAKPVCQISPLNRPNILHWSLTYCWHADPTDVLFFSVLGANLDAQFAFDVFVTDGKLKVHKHTHRHKLEPFTR
jgi:hypothetical protein